MKNPFTAFFRSRDKPQDAVSGATTFYFGSSASGKTVNPRNAVQVSTVYACVRVIAETIASLPLAVYEETDNGSRKATEHSLYHLLHDEPNPEMTSFVMRETMLTHLLLWGNSYSQIIRSGRNKIVGLYPLLPDKMEVDRDKNGVLTYTYTTTEGAQVILSPMDVLHIPGLGFDGIMGYSPIALEKNAIGLGIAAEEYGSRFFQNGARPSGILTHPNTVKDPKRLRESWNAAYGGSINGSKVAILEESMTFTPISLPNNEAQFLETRKFQVEEICRIFRVPPHLVGNLDRATFSNIENQSIDFAVHTIRPWLVRIEQSMNKALFVDSEKGHFYAQFNIDGLMRGDYKSRMEGYSIGRQNRYSFSCDAEFKLLSGTQTATTYNVYAYLYTLAEGGTAYAAGTLAAGTLYVMGTYPQALKGTVLSKRVEWTFTVPANAVKLYFLFACERTTASNYAANDYIELRNLKLERGNRATDWTAAPEDEDEEIELKLSSVRAQISTEADSIRSEVQANYALASDMTQVKNQVSTLSEQTESNYTWAVTRINQMQQDMEHAQEATEEQLAIFRTYMTFDENGLAIGKTGNPFTFRVVNDRLAFYMNDTEVAYLSNNKLYVTQAEILSKLIIGKFAFEPQSNGNLSLIYNG